jgi:nitrile hydratase subunit beta
MNGAHDMGGMQSFGRVEAEKDEPVFHARWEGRVQALWSALGAWRKWTTDHGRQIREAIPAEEYFALSYSQRRYVQLVELLVEAGLISRAELVSGRAARDAQKAVPPLTGSGVAAWFANGSPKRRAIDVEAQFRVGQQVRARNINPLTHTRLPRYVRGKAGLVERDHGVFVFPDTNAVGLGEKPQHVYSVRFMARELWGAQAKPQDTVVVNLFDDYLEAI